MRTGLVLRDHSRKLLGMRHVLSVDGYDDIAGLDARLFRRAARLHLLDPRAVRRVHPERLLQVIVHTLDHDADTPARYVPGRDELRQYDPDRVDRDREA